jgi:hypothetical protein
VYVLRQDLQMNREPLERVGTWRSEMDVLYEPNLLPGEPDFSSCKNSGRIVRYDVNVCRIAVKGANTREEENRERQADDCRESNYADLEITPLQVSRHPENLLRARRLSPSIDDSIFHHKAHLAECGDVGERIA